MANPPLRDVDDKYWQEYWRIVRTFLPNTKNSQAVYEELLGSYIKKGDKWVDVGCGHILFHSGGNGDTQRIKANVGVLVGLDGDLPSLLKNRDIPYRVAGDLGTIPFRDDYFTILTCNMVIEHIANPTIFVKEIARILQPGGIAIIHTPNLLHWEVLTAYLTPHWFHELMCWLLEKRKPEDIYPVFYKANTLRKLRKLFHSVGMTLDKGGTITETPRRFPIPWISRILLCFSIAEVCLLSLRPFSPFRHNLLMAFRKRESVEMLKLSQESYPYG